MNSFTLAIIIIINYLVMLAFTVLTSIDYSVLITTFLVVFFNISGKNTCHQGTESGIESVSSASESKIIRLCYNKPAYLSLVKQSMNLCVYNVFI